MAVMDFLRNGFDRLQSGARSVGAGIAAVPRLVGGLFRRDAGILPLEHFEGVLPVELKAIDDRRARFKRPPVQALGRPESMIVTRSFDADRGQRRRSPDPRQIFGLDRPPQA